MGVGAAQQRPMRNPPDGEPSTDRGDVGIGIAADDELVGIGQVKIDPTTRSPGKDIEDKIYKIRPANKNQRYDRKRVGNFLYKLEAESRRVKVTSLDLRPADNLKPGEIGDDRWTFEASITSRSQTSSSN